MYAQVVRMYSCLHFAFSLLPIHPAYAAALSKCIIHVLSHGSCRLPVSQLTSAAAVLWFPYQEDPVSVLHRVVCIRDWRVGNAGKACTPPHKVLSDALQAFVAKIPLPPLNLPAVKSLLQVTRPACHTLHVASISVHEIYIYSISLNPKSKHRHCSTAVTHYLWSVVGDDGLGCSSVCMEYMPRLP